MPAPLRPIWALLAAAILALAATAPVAAHTDLLSTDPADGQSLAEPPEQVVLRFSADLLAAGAQLRVVDESGTQVELGPVRVQKRTVSADWPASAATGAYRVSYRAVARDGHPLQGTFSFRVEGDSAASESPVPADTASATTPAPTPAPESGGSGPNLLLPGLFLVAVGVVGVLVWRLRAD